jgi:hypothetical protein
MSAKKMEDAVDDMMSLDHVLSQWGLSSTGEFKPCAHYYSAMDHVLYLREDVSYRAERVDRFLSLLRHPHEERLVGLKVEGWRSLSARLQCILRSAGAEVVDSGTVPLSAAVEMAMTAGAAAAWATLDVQNPQVARGYAQARLLAAGVTFDSAESGMPA